LVIAKVSETRPVPILLCIGFLAENEEAGFFNNSLGYFCLALEESFQPKFLELLEFRLIRPAK
jgi:hypothetical protein